MELGGTRGNGFSAWESLQRLQRQAGAYGLINELVRGPTPVSGLSLSKAPGFRVSARPARAIAEKVSQDAPGLSPDCPVLPSVSLAFSPYLPCCAILEFSFWFQSSDLPLYFVPSVL